MRGIIRSRAAVAAAPRGVGPPPALMAAGGAHLTERTAAASAPALQANEHLQLRYAGICESRTTRRTSSSSGSSTRSMMPYSTAGKRAGSLALVSLELAKALRSTQCRGGLQSRPSMPGRPNTHTHNAWRRRAVAPSYALHRRIAPPLQPHAARTCFVGVEVLWPRNVLGNLLLTVACVLGQQPHLRAGRTGDIRQDRCERRGCYQRVWVHSNTTHNQARGCAGSSASKRATTGL